MITPRKMPSGKWQARHIVNGQVRSAGTYTTKKEAEAVTAALVTDVRRGVFDDGTEGTVLFKDWASPAIERMNISDGTRYNYDGFTRRELIPFFGEMRLRDIDSDDVELWWRKRKLGTRTAFIALSAIFTQAVKSKKPAVKIPVNPCREADAGKMTDDQRPLLELDDFWKLVDAADDQMRLFLLVSWGASLRLGEVLGLDWNRVNLKTGRLDVVQQFTPARALTLPKNEKKRMGIMLYTEVQEALIKHRGTLATIGGVPVLTKASGARLNREWVYSRWTALRTKTGLEEYHVHDIRHLSLTLFAQSGATLRELMHRAGHSKPETVLIYQHLAQNRDEQLIDKVAALTARSR